MLNFFFFFAEHLYYLRASLVAQILKNPPSMRDSWVRKIPWRREQLPTLVFHGQRSLAGYSPRARQESDTTEHLSLTHTHTHARTHTHTHTHARTHTHTHTHTPYVTKITHVKTYILVKSIMERSVSKETSESGD